MLSIPVRLGRCWRFALVLIGCALAPSAQRQSWEGWLVGGIDVVGNDRIAAEVVLSRMRTEVNQPFLARVLAHDLRTLCGGDGFFETADVHGRLRDDRLWLTISVREPPFLEAVTIKGAHEQPLAEVREALGLRVPRPVTDATVAARVRALIDWYRDRGHAHAQVNSDRIGTELILAIDEGPRVRVDDVRLSGQTGLARRELIAAITSRPGELYRAVDAEDLERQLLDALRLRGYFDATARVLDLEWSTDFASVVISVEVDAGARYRVSGVEFRGTGRFADVELRSMLELRAGEPFDGDAMIRDTRSVLRLYQRSALIDVTLLDDGLPRLAFAEDGPEVTIVYRLREGRPIRLGRIRLEGNVTTKDRVILRDFDLRPGALVDQSRVDRALHRLRDRGYFASVEAEWATTDEDGTKDLVVHVEEQKTGVLDFAVATDLDQGAVAILSLDKRNFDLFGPGLTGGGQRLQIELAPGTEFNEGRLRFVEPALFGTPWNLSLGATRRTQRFDTYRTSGTGGALTIGRRLDRDLGWRDRLDASVAFGLESTDFEDRDSLDDITVPVDPWRIDQVIRTRSIEPSLQYRGGWDVIDGVRGLGLGASAEYASGSVSFLRWSGHADATVPLSGDKPADLHTLRLRIATGWFDRIGGTEAIPLSERFFIGGSRSLRGLDYHGVGPRGRFGRIAGGEAIWSASTEYRFPIHRDRLRGLVFSDAGSLGDRPFDAEFRRTRITAGVGVRFELFGLPVGIDIGFPLLRDRDDDRRVLALTIGELRF